MLHEIHEVLGVTAAWGLGLTVAVGLAVYLYARLRGRAPLKRQTLVRWHGRVAAVFALVLAAHVLTTDRFGPHVVAGAGALGAALLLGLSLRWSRRHFHGVVRAKLFLVGVASALLLYGHSVLPERPEAPQAFAELED